MEHYSVLNLPFDATPAEIRAAYFDAVRKYHPDAQNGENDGARFIEIQQAYETLVDDKQRAAYDRSLPESAREASPTQVGVRYSRSTIHRSDEPQLIYALLDLSCTKKIDPTDLPSAHICVILDRSSSMRGERLDMVRANLVRLIRKLKSSDVLSVVTFSDRAEVLVQPVTLSDPARVESLIMGISAGGATEIFQGLELGFEVFKRYAGRSNFLKHLILITDGHTYGDEERCYEIAERAAVEGISIHALGIGHEWNDGFLDRLASLSGGNSVYISAAEDLVQFIEQNLHSLSINYARKSELILDLPEHVTLNYAFRFHPNVSPLEVNFPIQLGPLEYGRNTSVILEFKINRLSSIEPEQTIANGKVYFEIPSKTIPIERQFVEIRRPVRNTWVKEKTPTAIFTAISRLSLYRLQEKIRKEAVAGDIESSSLHLKYLASRFMAQGNQDLARTALMEADHLQKHQRFSDEGLKDIKYGTRSLFLLPDPELKNHDSMP
ncbi:MAG: VWA domain-containing protein [Bellilinea sp.]